MFPGLNWALCVCHSMPGELPRDSWCFSLLLSFGSLFLFIHDILLKDSYPSICAWLLSGGIDAILFSKFSNLHLLLSGHGISDCFKVPLKLFHSHERCHFRLCWLTHDHYNMNKLHIVAVLYDHLTKVRHHSIQIIAILSDGALMLFISAFNSKLLILGGRGSAIVMPL